MEESSSHLFRDKISDLYTKCRCGHQAAFAEIQDLEALMNYPSPEDHLVVKGYLGDLFLICDTDMISRNEKRGKLLLSELTQVDRGFVTCRHLQHLLGVYFQECCDDASEALVWFQKAADQNLSLAQSTVGYFLDYGLGVLKNSKKAFSLYYLAAEQGFAVAQCNLGKCYDSGQGCEENATMATEYFLKAAEQGYLDAQFNLGVFYQLGRGVTQSYENAAEWFHKAALQGDASAQYNLAWCYNSGKGVPFNLEEAFKWCKLSARKSGDAHALAFLGFMYCHGSGVEVNIIEGVKYFRKAVLKGDAYATRNMPLFMDRYKEAVRAITNIYYFVK